MAQALRRGQLSGPETSMTRPGAGFGPLTRFAPALTIAVLVGPIVFGFLGTALPAFGYLPGLGGMDFTLSHFTELAGEPGIARSVVLSLLSGLVTTLISVLLLMTFTGGYLGGRMFAAMRRLLAPLLAVPHAAAAFGLAFLIAPSGEIARLVSPSLTGWSRPPDLFIVHDPMGLAMIAGLVIKEIPFLFLVTLAALPQLNHADGMRLGRSLGYGRVASFTYLVWPGLYRQIRLAVLAVLAYATSVVDVALILGPQLPAPLPVRLIEWMNDPDLTMRYLASAGAVLQLLTTLSAILIWLGLERAGAALVAAFRDRGRRMVGDIAARATGLAGMTAAVVAIVGGIVVLGLWSVAGLWQFPDALPASLTGRSWMRALPRLIEPLTVTLVVSALSAGIAVVLTLLCLEREHETRRSGGARALMLLYLPLIVPQISFLFGMQYLAILGGFDGSLAGLVLAHLVFVLPYVFLSLSDPWRSHDRRYDTIAAGLGMGRLRTVFTIRLPMLTRAVLTAFAVGFAVSVGQYLPTVLIGAGRLTTITSEAVALSAGGNRRVIGVYAALQTVLPFLAFAIATALPGLLFRNRRGLRV
jgi:putative thiamine transport system permease protein